MTKIYFIICVFCVSCFVASGQSFYRMKVDITIKVKNLDSTFQYTKGIVRYDKNFKKIVYDITFPQKEFYLSQDTLIYKYQGEKLISTIGSPFKPEFSIFHFILNNDISDFGLKNSSFKATNVDKVNDLIITKWTAPNSPKFPLGNIIVSSRNKRLQSVVLYGKKGEILSRQIFKKYTFVSGLEVPTEILAINYINGSKTYQIIQFDKVQVNEPGHDAEYDFQAEKYNP